MSQVVKYSIVVPVYNSERSIEQLFERIKKMFDSLRYSFEVIFIEDGGKDNSWSVICSLKDRFPEHVTAIQLSRNFGQHNATLCGFNYVTGDYVITIDDDLQIPPEEIPKLIHAQAETNAELVYGIYDVKRHDSIRNFGSYLVQRIVQNTFNAEGPITSFRLLTFSLCERTLRHHQSFVYIEGLFYWHTQNVARVLVEHKKRIIGASNYTFGKLFKLTLSLIFNFTTLPLRAIILLGMVFAILSFSMGVFFVLRKIIYEVPLGYTSIIVSIYFTSSILLLMIGVIGEYISRLHSIQSNRPQYSIKEVLK
jgi:polyisoprenyl-phosphate glycosyltransferase